jgi:hypothetical protein
MSGPGKGRTLGTGGCLTLIVSENWTMELRQTSASRDSELSQDAANWYGIESYQAFGGVGQPDLVTHQVSKCPSTVSWVNPRCPCLPSHFDWSRWVCRGSQPESRFPQRRRKLVYPKEQVKASMLAEEPQWRRNCVYVNLMIRKSITWGFTY